MKRYVIIGGSIAGVSCVEGIRSADAQGEITLVTAEPVSNYGRPLISYYLEGKTDTARMSWRGADFYERYRVNVLHETRAKSIDAAAHTVALSNGGNLSYDALCVCTGSAPVCPKFEGLETVPHRQFFTTLADAQTLERTVTKQTRALIIGAGFIGLKCAEGLRDRAGSVTVCDLAKHAMSANLDADSAPILERHLERSGIRLMLGDTVAALAMQDSAVACFTKPYPEAAAPTLLIRAQTLMAMGKYRQAVMDLNDYEHLKFKEVNANFYYQRYQAEMRCRMFQQALNDIERCTTMEPREPLFFAELAATHYRFNQVEEAVTAARQAIALDPEFPDAHRILGVCLRAQNKESEAQAALKRAADLGDETAKGLISPKP